MVICIVCVVSSVVLYCAPVVSVSISITAADLILHTNWSPEKDEVEVILVHHVVHYAGAASAGFVMPRFVLEQFGVCAVRQSCHVSWSDDAAELALRPTWYVGVEYKVLG